MPPLNRRRGSQPEPDPCLTFAAGHSCGMIFTNSNTDVQMSDLDEDSDDESSSDSSPPAIARRSKFDDEEEDSDVCAWSSSLFKIK